MYPGKWLVMVATVSAAAVGQENLVRNGDFTHGLDEWSLQQDETCSAAMIQGGAGGQANALRLVLKPPPGSATWSINLNQAVEGDLNQGDRLSLKAWLRSPQSCRVLGYVEIAREPWSKSVSAQVTLSPEWQEFEFTGISLGRYGAGDTHLGFHLAYDTGTVEISGVRLVNLDAKPVAAGPRPTLATPLSMIVNGDFSAGLAPWAVVGGERLRAELVDAEIGAFRRAMRLHCNPAPGNNPWVLQVGQPCEVHVRRNDAVHFRAWLRSPDRCRVTFVYELAREPHPKSISQMARLTPEWQEYRFMGRAGQGFQPGDSQAKLFLGHDAGVVEVAGIRVENCGAAPDSAFAQTIDYWGGHEHPDTWRAAALERIEQYRKGDLTVKVVDATGNPLANVPVRVTQLRHRFGFGTALPAGRLVHTQNADNVRFQAEVERLFNTATFENDLKWPAMSGANQATVERAATWLAERGIALRGHCLLWGSFQHLHTSVRDRRGQELLAACREHVADYATRMRGKLYLWDVVNEAATNVEVWDNVGWDAFADAFRWARAADPEALLCYNDYGILDDAHDQRAKVRPRIQYLLDRQVPLDVLGIQGHMHTPLTPPHRLLEILDQWAAFGKDIEVTEFDVGCADDQVHADYVRDFMTVVFSHPRVRAFIMWGFWEGSHWRAKDSAAMFRRDWSRRPAQDVYEELVLKQWWTRWSGTTGADGSAALRAFCGRHRAQAEVNGQVLQAEVDLARGQPATVLLRLP